MTLLNWDISKSVYLSQNEGDGLYAKELEDACFAISEITNLIGDVRHGDMPANPANTVIGIAGERGSGKTSFIQSLNARIEKYDTGVNDRITVERNASKLSNLYSLGYVEPSNFSSNMNILELFLTRVYSLYKKRFSKKSSDSAEVYRSARIHKIFKDISNTLSVLRIDKSMYSDENPSIEILSEMDNLTDIRRKIWNLCVEFLSIVNSDLSASEFTKTNLVLFVDDADLTSSNDIYRLLEDIRKYLSGTVIVVVAYRRQQLIESVLDHLIKENNNLLVRNSVSVSSLRNQAEDFIEKVVPKDRTFELYSQSQLMGLRFLDVFEWLVNSTNRNERIQTIKKVFITKYSTKKGKVGSFAPNTQIDENITVRDWLDEAIYRKTLIGITPVNGQEDVSLLWPRNLRELLTLVHIIEVKMLDPWTLNNIGIAYETCKQNLEIYKRYFLGNIVEAFGAQRIEAINRWMAARAEEKNYVAYSVFFNMLFDKLKRSNDYPDNDGPIAKESILGDLLSIDIIHPLNITVGDVYTVVNKFISSSLDDELDVYFAYSFKLLYSIELLDSVFDLLINIKKEHGNQYVTALSRYNKIVNMSVLPPEPFSNNLSESIRIPNREAYEKLLMVLQDIIKIYKKESDANDYSEEDDERLLRRKIIKAINKYEIDSNNLRALVSISFDEYRDIISKFISPRVPINGSVFNSSRPMRMDFVSDSHTRAAYRDIGRSGRYQSNYNRLIFLESSDSDASNDHLLGIYSLNLLNIIVDSNHLETALRSIFDGNGGGYIFYSLFDLDVFTTVTYDEKRGRNKLANQMQRLNAAFSIASNTSDEYAVKDRRIKRINIPFEKELFCMIRTPFIFNFNGALVLSNELVDTKYVADFSVFVDNEQKDAVEGCNIVLFDLFSSVFLLSELIHDFVYDLDDSRSNLRVEEIDEIIGDVIAAEKHRVIEFLDLFSEELKSRGSSSSLNDIQNVAKALKMRRTRLTDSRKREVEKSIRNNQFAAYRAYRKWEREDS